MPKKLAAANKTSLIKDNSPVLFPLEIMAAPTIKELTTILKESRLAESSTLRRKGSKSLKPTFHCKVSELRRSNNTSNCPGVLKERDLKSRMVRKAVFDTPRSKETGILAS